MAERASVPRSRLRRSSHGLRAWGRIRRTIRGGVWGLALPPGELPLIPDDPWPRLRPVIGQLPASELDGGGSVALTVNFGGSTVSGNVTGSYTTFGDIDAAFEDATVARGGFVSEPRSSCGGNCETDTTMAGRFYGGRSMTAARRCSKGATGPSAVRPPNGQPTECKKAEPTGASGAFVQVSV